MQELIYFIWPDVWSAVAADSACTLGDTTLASRRSAATTDRPDQGYEPTKPPRIRNERARDVCADEIDQKNISY
jgi:hypothetical protein